jgi:hypothetical protein
LESVCLLVKRGNMRSRDFLSVIAVLAALSGTTACSSKSDSSQSMAPQGNDSFSTRSNESPPAPLNPSTAQLSPSTTALPATTAAPENYPSQSYSVPARTSPRTTTTSATRRNYQQSAPSPAPAPYTAQSVVQSTTQSSGEYGYPPVNEAANQSSIPYNDSRANGVLPAANAPYPGGGGYANAGSGGDGDRHVRVNVPFVHLNVDKDTGGVHLDAPFVHINKPSRYDQSQVSVPDRSDQSAALNQDRY